MHFLIKYLLVVVKHVSNIFVRGKLYTLKTKFRTRVHICNKSDVMYGIFEKLLGLIKMFANLD